ncbi:hypothetical protein MLD38_027437 [Melastoma candidum]|uniref:Uncharacterized protein n=1 Tax=Melastoma candidum TaxID=119954 RepID=A0ACB9P6B9_9MYRT|nr:hypothetical protein MLD38_027437 [Melastoma candidum]
MDLNRRLPASAALAVTVFFLISSGGVDGNLVFNVRRKFSAKESLLSVSREHDFRRRGRILTGVDLPLGGNGHPSGTGLYFTKIGMGTPPKYFYVQVDTGSDLLWLNCIDCIKCPRKSDLGIKLSLYDPKISSTANLVTCDEGFCTATYSGPLPGCKPELLCQYNVVYGDGSSTSGYFVRDNVQFDAVTGDLQTSSANGSVIFGCGNKQTGELGSSSEAVDGILGFGQANSSMLSQLALSGKVKKIFSHCLDGDNGGGIFAIGEVVEPKVDTTPLVPNQSHYNVKLKTIAVGGHALQLPTDIFDTGSGRGTVIDSGTTLAYLPDEVYKEMMTAIMANQPQLKLYTIEEQYTCFHFGESIDKGFPVVEFHFDGSLTLTVYPHEYFFPIGQDQWCVGWQNSGVQSRDGKDMTLLGDLVLLNKLVVYDLEKQTLGLTEYNCSSSIKIKDEKTGAVYTVGAHNLGSASALVVGRLLQILSFFVLGLYTLL